MPKKISPILIAFLLLVTGCSAPTNIPPTQTLVPTIVIPSQTATQEATVTPSPSPSPTETPLPTATATPEPSPTPTPAVLIGAGDIANCGEENQGDENTAAIIARQVEQYPHVVVFTSGDDVYGEGRAVEYRNCFDPSWGQFNDRLRPVPGNHDYMTDLGGPYYEYFGEAAGPAGLGYYSYDLGDWHIVGLNSNCNEIACGPDSLQAQWLREDLENAQASCTLLYWHHPRFSSGIAGGSGSVNTFWKIASEYGAEIVVNGHDHNYERFAPMDAEGNANPTGIRLFVVGTGGAHLRAWGEIKPNSEARLNESHGVIKFLLYPGRYEWQFLPTEGAFSDTGSGECH